MEGFRNIILFMFGIVLYNFLLLFCDSKSLSTKTWVKVPLGQNATLVCSATDVPPSLLWWTKRTTGCDVINTGALFRISGVKLDDDGIYICHGENMTCSNISISIFHLDVLYPPIPDERFRNRTSITFFPSLRNDVNMTYNFNGNPAPAITWYFDKKIQPRYRYSLERNHHSVRTTLYLTDTSIMDYGVYTVFAKNSQGICKASFNVTNAGRIKDIPYQFKPAEELPVLAITGSVIGCSIILSVIIGLVYIMRKSYSVSSDI